MNRPTTLPRSVRELEVRARQHWNALLFVVLVAAVMLAYAPVWHMGMTTDDYIEIGVRHFDALDSIPSQNWGLWITRFAERAFIDPVTGWGIFRPVRQWLFWSDYVMWHLNPLGYHLSNLIWHLLTSLLIALIAWRLTRQKYLATLAGLVFAVQFIHGGPVAGISSRGHVLAGLFAAWSLLFYLLPRRPFTLGMSLLGFALALGSKETAAILPGLLLLYELTTGQLTDRKQVREVVQRQVPFWLMLGGYLLLRVAITGQVANSPYGLGQWNWQYQLAGYSEYAFAPFLTNLTFDPTLLALACYVLALFLYRARPVVVFGLLWVPLALLPTLTFPPQDRYFYTPSIGLALALAGILADPIPALRRWSRLLSLALVLLLSLSFTLSVSSLLEDYVRGSQVVTRFLQQVRVLHPTFPSNSRIFVVGLPEMVKRGYVLSNPLQIQYALQLEYGDRSMQVVDDKQFPLFAQDLERTFFLEYDGGRVTDRTDLLQAIQARRICPDTPPRSIAWTFGQDSQGWEAWSQISDLQVQAGALSFRTTGNDPFLASPVLEIPVHKVGPVEIKMAAQSAQARLHGELYFQTAGMADFSPAIKLDFTIPADGDWHTLVLDLPPPLAAAADEPLVRLRLDPGDAVAAIRIAAIQIECR